MALTEYDVRRAFRLLTEAGFRAHDVEPTAMVARWKDVLGDAAPHELVDAIEVFLRGDSPYWPKPGEIRAIMLAQRDPAYWRAQPDEAPCAPAGYAREAWSRYLDLDDLEAAHRRAKLRKQGAE